MQINAKTVMANTVAINSTKVKTIGNSNQKRLFVVLVQIFELRFT